MKEILKIFKFCVKVSPSYLISRILLAIFQSILPFIPLFYGRIILNQVVESMTSNMVFYDIFYNVILMVILTFIVGLATSFLTVLCSYYNETTFYKTNSAIIKKSLFLNYETLVDSENKNMLRAAEQGSNGFGGIADFINLFLKMVESFLNIIYSCFFLSSIFVTIDKNGDSVFQFFNSVYSSLIVLALFVVLIVFSIFLVKFQGKANKIFFENNIQANTAFGYIFDSAYNYSFGKDIRIYGYHKLIHEKMVMYDMKFQKGYYSFLIKITALSWVGIVINTIILLYSYIFIGGKVYFGILDVGMLVTLAGSITQFSSAISASLQDVGEIIIMKTYLSYFYDYVNKKEEVSVIKNKISEIKAPYVYEFKNVYFKYPHTEEYILENVSFKINSNQRTAIVGKNGAGKSTIIKLLSRLYKVDKGEILLNGININNFDFDDYQSFISVLFQDFSLLGVKLKENVASSYDNIDEKMVLKCLEDTNFPLYRFKNGIDTSCYNTFLDDGVELSGGEAQKLGISRALYKNSPYVVLDEPTSALDPKSEEEVYLLLNKLINDKTAIFISHRMSSTIFCDDIIVIDKGDVTERGNHNELMKNTNGLYYKMFKAQAKYYEENEN